MEGWVKLWRNILDWEWFDDSAMYKFYSCLFVMANHEDTNWHGITIYRGQLLTSREKLANRLHFTEQQVRTMLSKLQKTQEISCNSTNKYTIITICNYDKYQNGDRVEQPTNNQQTANKQPTNNQQTANKQPTNNQQITTNNNDNNDNNGNKDNIIYIADEIFDADKSATNKPQPKTIDERKNDFMQQVAEKGVEKYGQEMCRDFFDYWTESNPNGKKMRFEMQKVFDIKKRLATWNKNNLKKQNYGANQYNNPASPDYVTTERIVAAGREWAKHFS